ncbi:carbohydrate kinase [Pillotina sp. SPG140]
MYDVTALGELLIDFSLNGINDRGIALFAQNPGGAPANVLAMVTCLGGKTAFIGKVGCDAFGRFLLQTLENAGIDSAGLVLDSTVLTTLAFVQLDAQGDRSFSFYRKNGADLMLTSAEVKKELIDNGAIFHCGSVSLTDEPCRSTVHTAVRYAKDRGKIISYDPNYRPFLWNSEEEAQREMAALVPYADILKVSEEEMVILTGTTEVKKGAARLFEQGPAIVLISLGAQGAFYYCANGSGTLPAYDVPTVDTTGAGDAFLGTVLFYVRNKTRRDLETITQDELADIVDCANAAGSLTTTAYGAIPAMPDKNSIAKCRQAANTVRG